MKEGSLVSMLGMVDLNASITHSHTIANSWSPAAAVSLHPGRFRQLPWVRASATPRDPSLTPQKL